MYLPLERGRLPYPSTHIAMEGRGKTVTAYDRGGGKVEGSLDKLNSSGLKNDTQKEFSYLSPLLKTESAKDRAVVEDHVGGRPKIQ